MKLFFNTRRILNKSSYYASTTFVALVSIILTGWVGRGLGPESFAFYSVLFAFGALLIVFLDFGFKVKITKEFVTQAGHDRYVSTSFSESFWQALFISVATLFLLLVCGLFQFEIIALIVLIWSTHILQLYSTMMRALSRFNKDALVSCFSRSLSALLVIAVLYQQPPNVGSIFFSWAAANICVIFILLLKKEISLTGPTFNFGNFKQFRYLFAMDLLTVMLLRFDILVATFADYEASDIGHYSSAFKFIECVYLFIIPIRLAILRRFRLNYVEPSQHMVSPVALMFAFILIGCVFYLCFSLIGATLLIKLFGDQFNKALIDLETLILGVIFIPATLVLTEWLIAQNKEKTVALCMAMALIVGTTLLYVGPTIFDDYNLSMNRVIIELFMFFGLMLATLKLHFFRVRK